MIRGGKTLVLVLGGFVFSLGARALTPDSAGNPYGGITERNVFSLKPPTPAPPPPQPVLPPVKLTLTGIMTIFGKKQALISAQVPPRPPEPAKQESYMLAEGQRDADIEVLVIDEKAGTVKVNNHGIVETLDFVNNGAKLVNAPPPVAPPPSIPPPMRIPGAPNASAGGGGLRAIPPRIPPLSQPSGPQPNAQPAQAIAGNDHSVGANSQFQNPISPEDQTILIEAQRMKFRQEGDETYKILPHTEITQELMPEEPSPF